MHDRELERWAWLLLRSNHITRTLGRLESGAWLLLRPNHITRTLGRLERWAWLLLWSNHITRTLGRLKSEVWLLLRSNHVTRTLGRLESGAWLLLRSNNIWMPFRCNYNRVLLIRLLGIANLSSSDVFSCKIPFFSLYLNFRLEVEEQFKGKSFFWAGLKASESMTLWSWLSKKSVQNSLTVFVLSSLRWSRNDVLAGCVIKENTFIMQTGEMGLTVVKVKSHY